MYENNFAQEENLRNPKNRFLGLFCHANEVDNGWAGGCPFWVGVVILSIIVGISAFSDIPSLVTIGSILSWFNTFAFMVTLRIVSDIFCLVGIIYALLSICRQNYDNAVYAYYCMIVTFVINTIFFVYLFYVIFKSYHRRRIKLRYISWFGDEFILVLFCWFLFCNMVVIGRRNRQQNLASNSFI